MILVISGPATSVGTGAPHGFNADTVFLAKAIPAVKSDVLSLLSVQPLAILLRLFALEPGAGVGPVPS